jgi:hypothetical protein
MGFFLFAKPPIQWVPAAPTPVVKQSGRQTDHSPPSGAEVKSAWNYTSTPPVRLHCMALNYAGDTPSWHDA